MCTLLPLEPVRYHASVPYIPVELAVGIVVLFMWSIATAAIVPVFVVIQCNYGIIMIFFFAVTLRIGGERCAAMAMRALALHVITVWMWDGIALGDTMLVGYAAYAVYAVASTSLSLMLVYAVMVIIIAATDRGEFGRVLAVVWFYHDPEATLALIGVMRMHDDDRNLRYFMCASSCGKTLSIIDT